jgi:hypothetical protein
MSPCPAHHSRTSSYYVGAFESVTGSRTSAGGKGSGLREVWSRPQLTPRGGVEESPESVVAYAKQEPEGIPFGEHAARCPVNGHLPRHQIGAWMVGEDGGNNRDKFGV